MAQTTSNPKRERHVRRKAQKMLKFCKMLGMEVKPFQVPMIEHIIRNLGKFGNQPIYLGIDNAREGDKAAIAKVRTGVSGKIIVTEVEVF